MQFPSGSSVMQPGGHYMQQHQQAQQMTPQSLMAARSSMLYGQQPYSSLQQQQALHGQLGMSSSGGTPGGLHMLQSEASAVGSTLGAGGFPDYGRGGSSSGGGSKQEMGSIGSVDGRGGSSAGQDGGGGENLYLKGGDDGNWEVSSFFFVG